MSSFLMIGRRLIPREQVALVEAFVPDASPNLQTTRDFRSRVVMINRDSILTELTPEGFAKEHGFRLLADESVAINPAVRFRVETFAPAADFRPAKPYATRLLWRDADGNDQSKLLMTAPETVLATVLGSNPAADQPLVDRKPPRRKAQRKRDVTSAMQP